MIGQISVKDTQCGAVLTEMHWEDGKVSSRCFQRRRGIELFLYDKNFKLVRNTEPCDMISAVRIMNDHLDSRV